MPFYGITAHSPSFPVSVLDGDSLSLGIRRLRFFTQQTMPIHSVAVSRDLFSLL
jgi:hypothetical protein